MGTIQQDEAQIKLYKKRIEEMATEIAGLKKAAELQNNSSLKKCDDAIDNLQKHSDELQQEIEVMQKRIEQDASGD